MSLRERSPSGRHRLRPFAIGLVIVLVLLVVVDRIAAAVTEHEAAKAIRSAQHLTTTPSVHIRGFPFLTQLLGSTIDRVDVSAKDFTASDSGHTVRIARLSATLRHVHLSGFSSARAETVTATALIDFSALSSRLGVPITFGGATSDGAGRLVATESVTVLGQRLSGTVSAEVQVGSGNVLTFPDPKVSVGGVTAPDAAVRALTAVFGSPIALANLPFDLTLRSVRATAAGVEATMTATNVTYG